MKKGRASKNKAKFLIINFIRLMLVFAFFEAFRNQRTLVFYTSIIALGVTFIPNFLNKAFKMKVPADFEIMILLFVYGLVFLGDIKGFFDFWWWDIFLNLIAATALGLIGLTVLFVLNKEERMDASPAIIAIFAFCFAFAIGGIWEIFEYGMDNLFEFNLQESSADTMKDLVVNSIGALFVSLGGYYYLKNGKVILISSLMKKFIEKYPKFFRSKKVKKNHPEIMKELISKGENRKLEFKSTLRTNLHTKEFDKKIEHSVLKTVSAYLNSDGGTLLVGVSDDGTILGLNSDKFENHDKLNLHLTNMIKHHIGNEYLPFIRHELVKLNEEHILKIDCKKSKKPIFMKVKDDEEFYIRNGPSTAKLRGSSILDYVNHKFDKE
jgi:hypothetical protein